MTPSATAHPHPDSYNVLGVVRHSAGRAFVQQGSGDERYLQLNAGAKQARGKPPTGQGGNQDLQEEGIAGTLIISFVYAAVVGSP